MALAVASVALAEPVSFSRFTLFLGCESRVSLGLRLSPPHRPVPTRVIVDLEAVSYQSKGIADELSLDIPLVKAAPHNDAPPGRSKPAAWTCRISSPIRRAFHGAWPSPRTRARRWAKEHPCPLPPD